jgi:excisionase family DNA binding protein
MQRTRTALLGGQDASMLVSIERAAQLLGDLSPWTVRRWIFEGRIKSNKIGRRRVVPMAEVERLIEETADRGPKRTHQE